MQSLLANARVVSVDALFRRVRYADPRQALSVSSSHVLIPLPSVSNGQAQPLGLPSI